MYHFYHFFFRQKSFSLSGDHLKNQVVIHFSPYTFIWRRRWMRWRRWEKALWTFLIEKNGMATMKVGDDGFWKLKSDLIKFFKKKKSRFHLCHFSISSSPSSRREFSIKKVQSAFFHRRHQSPSSPSYKSIWWKMNYNLIF